MGIIGAVLGFFVAAFMGKILVEAFLFSLIGFAAIIFGVPLIIFFGILGALVGLRSVPW